MFVHDFAVSILPSQPSDVMDFLFKFISSGITREIRNFVQELFQNNFS